jgi:hypothetical protein
MNEKFLRFRKMKSLLSIKSKPYKKSCEFEQTESSYVKFIPLLFFRRWLLYKAVLNKKKINAYSRQSIEAMLPFLQEKYERVSERDNMLQLTLSWLMLMFWFMLSRSSVSLFTNKFTTFEMKKEINILFFDVIFSCFIVMSCCEWFSNEDRNSN